MNETLLQKRFISTARHISVITQPAECIRNDVFSSEDSAIILIRQGAVLHGDQNRCVTSGKGLLFVIRAVNLKSVRLSDDFDGSLLVIPLMILACVSIPNKGNALVNAVGRPFIPLDDAGLSKFGTFYRLIAITDMDGDLHKFPALQLCGAMLAECQKYYQVLFLPDSTIRSRRLSNDFLILVGRYASQERHLAFYADRLCITSKHLSSEVKKCIDAPASEWIRRYAAIVAKEMLLEGSRTISEVAVAMNFGSTSNFSRFFKRETGMTPKQYIESF